MEDGGWQNCGAFINPQKFGGGACTKSMDVGPLFFTMQCYATKCGVCEGGVLEASNCITCFLFCSLFIVFGMVLCAHFEYGCEDDNLCQSMLVMVSNVELGRLQLCSISKICRK